MRGRMIGFTLLLGGIFLLTATWVHLVFPPAVEAQSVEVIRLQPVPPEAMRTSAPQLSASEREALLQRKLEIRRQMAARLNNNPPSPPGLPLVSGRQTQAVNPNLGTRFHGTPSQFVVGRNNKNTNATGPDGSTLAEPAAANNSRLVFAAGNFDHAEISTDGGVNWTNVPLPTLGPPDAPILCCDQDVVIDDARRVIFHSYLYINSNESNGVVRIDVRRSIAGPGQPVCSYLLDPAGTNNDILPDFPHLGLTKNFLWLTTNEIGPEYPGGQAARMYKLPMDAMADCLSPVSGSVFQWPSTNEGQRVWRPVEGANTKETMYWMHLANTTTARIFSWPETAASPPSALGVLRTISPSTFGNPDCRGGVGNFDWIDSLSASGIGFDTSGAVGHDRVAWYWQVAADAATNHNQGHIHAAVFSLAGPFTLISQPHIFNTNFCYGKPNVSANKEGDLGITLGAGGKAGGLDAGGTAAQSYVGIDDDFTSGIGVFGTVFLTASGTHNRSQGDERFGDYFTIHPYEPCEKWFTATNYALLNGATASNVNSRYVEFGRRRSFRCYDAHRNQYPESLTAPRE